jgi:hypothetical protein
MGGGGRFWSHAMGAAADNQHSEWNNLLMIYRDFSEWNRTRNEPTSARVVGDGRRGGALGHVFRAAAGSGKAVKGLYNWFVVSILIVTTLQNYTVFTEYLTSHRGTPYKPA